MTTKPRILAVIPARGGSKGIPGKNIRLLGGVPLIAYSIATGLQSKFIHRVMVSTDSPEIATIAQKYGAETPFLRPDYLAGDSVPDLPVFEHVLHWLQSETGYIPDIVVQLRPTSPFRPPQLIDSAIASLLANPAVDSVRCVTASGQNPYKMWKIELGKLQPLLTSEWHEPYNMPRQELPDTFWQTGHLEVIRRQTIQEQKSMTGNHILPCFVEPEYAIDLDSLRDWDFAEYVLANWGLPLVEPQAQTGIVT